MTDDLEAFPDWVRVQSIRTNRLADKSTVGSAHLAIAASRVSAVSWLEGENKEISENGHIDFWIEDLSHGDEVSIRSKDEDGAVVFFSSGSSTSRISRDVC